jgi:cytochrome c-type biogenesis protein CcmH
MPDPLPPGGADQAQRPGPSENAAAGAESGQEQQIQAMVARLAARLETDPDDADGWLMLGRSYGVLGDREGSRAAFARAAELRPDDVQVLSVYARSLLDDPSGTGPLPAQARDLYNRILDLDGENPEALYFSGLAETQAGNTAAGIVRWEHLLTLLEPSSEAYRIVQEGLAALRPAE